jgi:transposase
LLKTNVTAPELTVGMDVGDARSALCVLDSSGFVVDRLAVPTSKPGVTKVFKGRERMRVALEVGSHSAWLSDLLEKLGHEVIVANARQLDRLSKSNNKNDENDAELLARMARVDVLLLSPVKHRDPEMRADLAVIRARGGLVESRTKLINTARGLVKTTGTKLPKCSAEAFHKKARPDIPKELAPAVGGLLKAIGELTKQIGLYDKKVAALVAKYPESQHLQQISGVGALTALAFMLTLGDRNRFAKSRDVGPYLGLVPRQQRSCTVDPQLRITKAGDGLVRRLLVGSSHYVLGRFGPDTDLRRWGLSLAARGGKNAKKRAVVAVARKLAVLLHRLWTTGEVYQPLRESRKKTAR